MMSIDTTRTPATNFGRRAFLKGSAATLGLVALTGAGCAPNQQVEEDEGASQAPEEQLYQGVCRGNCGGGCRMNVHVRDGKVVKTSKIDQDNPLDTRICQRGLTHPQRMYAPERVQYPMRRVEGTARGAGEWERLSWDEAVSYIAEKWKGYIDEFGGSSIGFTYCAGTYAYNQYVYARLRNCFGGTEFESPQDMAALQMAVRVVGRSTYLGGNDIHDVMNAKNIFFWGSNATVSGMHRMPYVYEARKKGAKLIVIDPVYNGIAAKADQWVPIRPGSDCALALAMMKIIVDEGKAAEEYLAKNTVAPFLVKDGTQTFLRMSDLGVEPTEGPVDPSTGKPSVIDPFVVVAQDGSHGVLEEVENPAVKGSFTVEGVAVTTAYQLLLDRIAEWTPEKASEVTDIPADTIVELAHTFADGPSHLNLGFGNDHWGNGGTITQCQFTLSLVAGQWGIPGGGVGGSQGQATTGMPQAGFKDAMYGPNAVFTSLMTDLQYLPMIMDTGKYGDMDLTIKSMFVYCGNVMMSTTDRNELMRAFDKIDLIITADTIMNDTTRYSDIVLPVPHWFEYETFSSCPSDCCDFNEKALDPQFECKEDIEIAKLIGLAMGYEDMDITPDEFHQLFFENDAAREDGISYEHIKETKHLKYAPDTYIYGNVDYGTVFNTVTQRAQFYIEDPKPRYDYGQELDKELVALPHFELPLEAWSESAGGYEKNALADSYPLTILSHRDKFKVHSTFALNPWLIELQPEPTLSINPDDAAARGIADGDYVRAYNDRGSTVLRAYHDPSMRPGVVQTEHGWLDEQYVDGAYNTLTSMATRHLVPTHEHFDALCEVEKYAKEA